MKFHTRGDTDRFSVFTSPQLLAVVELFSTHEITPLHTLYVTVIARPPLEISNARSESIHKSRSSN